MPAPIDRAGFVLLTTAMLGPLLLSLNQFNEVKAPAAVNSDIGGVAQKTTVTALPKLDVVALVPPKSSVTKKTKVDRADFPVRLKVGRDWIKDAKPSYITAGWFPHTANSSVPVLWGKALIQVDAGDFSIISGTLKDVPVADLGSGVLRIYTCPDSGTYTSSRCGVASADLELALQVDPVATNTDLLSVPLIFAFVCLAIATVLVVSKKGWKPRALAAGSVHWRAGDSWVATLNAGSAIVSSFAALGLQPSSFGSIVTPKEYAAWIAIYALCTVLATTVFGLLKVVKPGNPPQETGTLVGFYAANIVNLTGMGGQLLLSRFGFQALDTGGILAPPAANILSYVPVFLAIATLWYVVQRFLLICAPTPPTIRTRLL